MTKHSGLLAWTPARESRALTRGRKAEAQQSARAEVTRIMVTMRCAVTDKEFVILFRGNALKPDVYFVERVTPASSTKDAEARTRTDGITFEIPVERLPFDDVTCPFCSVSPVGPVRCGRCRQLVCEGRLKGDVFYCTKTCGASGKTAPGALQHVSGRQGQSTPLLGTSSTPRLAAPNTKLIGRLK